MRVHLFLFCLIRKRTEKNQAPHHPSLAAVPSSLGEGTMGWCGAHFNPKVGLKLLGKTKQLSSRELLVQSNDPGTGLLSPWNAPEYHRR